jgi:hypothetical protein
MFAVKNFRSGDASTSYSVGNQGPVETAWRRSSDYPYAMQRAIALTRPAFYFGSMINIDRYLRDTKLDQLVNAETLQRITPKTVVINGEPNGTDVKRTAGYINWVRDYVKNLGQNPDVVIRKKLDNLDVRLGYRVAGYTDKNYIKILAEQSSPTSVNDSVILPDENYNVHLNKSSPTKKIVYSGVIVEKTSGGYTVSGYDLSNPYFTIIPSLANNNAYVVEVMKMRGVIYRDYQNKKVVVPYGYEFTSRQQLVDFLIGHSRYLVSQGFQFSETDGDLGEKRNWILSIKEFLHWSQQGWDNGNLIILSPAFDSLRVRVPNGVVDFIKNTPNGSKILDQNFSVIKSNQSTVYRNGGEFKISALEKQTICLAELDIVQYEHVLIFDNVTVFNDIIYKAESGNRQFRLKLLGNKTGNWTGEFNPPGFIYNSPTVPNWQSGVDYKKGSIVQFKDQYYTALENVIAATEFQQTKWQAIDRSSLKSGLLPNLAYNSQKFETIYDIDNPLADNDLLTYGAGLIGFRERDYLSDLSLGGISQIKFYQGFIKEKGTKNAVDSLTSAQFNNIAGGIDIYEEWALRVGEYGALESDARIEIPLDDSVFTDNPSTIQFIQGRIQTAETGAIGIDQNNLYRQPSKFKTNIFYHRNENSSTHDDITTAGYVNLEDVDGTIFNITDYQNLDDMLPKIGKGFKLWVAKDFDNEWNVYRVNETNNNINRLTYELDDYMAVHFDHAHTLSVGNVFVIKNLDDRFDGFYRVERVQDSLTVSVLLYKNINQLKDTRLITGNGVFLKTESMRVDDPVRIDDLEPLHGWQINDRIWADTVDVDGRWGVFEKTDPWEYLKEIKAEGSEPGGGDRFGHSIKINSRRDLIVSGSPGYSQGSIKTFVKLITGEFRQTSTFRPDLVPIALGFGRTLDLSDYICAVGAPDSDDQQGLVFVYNFQSEASDFAIQVLNAIDGSSDDLFGHSISMSQDGQWIYVGAPGADKVYVYHRELNINKEANTFITDPAETVDTLTWELPFEYDDANSLQISTTGRIFIPGKDYNIVDDTIVFVADPGEIIVEVKQAPFYKLVETIEGTSNSSFGYSVKTDIDGSTLIIGSPDEGTGEQGGVHVYNRRIEAQLTATGKKIFVPSNDSLDVVDVFIDGILKTLNEDYTVDGDEYIFAVAPDSGRRLEFSTKTWDLVEHIVSPDDVELNHFGRSIDTDEQGNSIYISAPDYRDSVYQRGKVYRYVRNSKYLKKAIGTSINPTLTPGDTIYINRFPVRFSGTTVNDLVIDINGAKIIGIQASVDQGRISIVDSMINSTIGLEIFDADNGDTLSLLGLETFTLEQTIICPEEGDEVFGSKVTVDQFNNTLLISAENASIMQSITFDSKSTTFDVNTTKFIKTVKGSGAVYMFENMSNSGTGITNTGKMIYAQKMTLQNVYPGDQFGFDTDISRDLLLISSPGLEPYPGTNEYDIKLDNLRELSFVDTSNITSGFRALIISDSGNDGLWSIWTYNGSIFQRSNIGRLSNIGTSHLYNNKNNARCWNLVRRQEPRVDLSSLNRAMIYNKKSNTISTNLDFIDPAKGKILGIAEQDIDFKTELDPAIYTNGDQRVIIDHDLRWGDRQVGMIWWDLSKVRYLDYEQGSLIYRTKNWGKVFPGSTIDVSEWVESSVPPAQYLANGGSGSPKYGDSVYVVDTTVDAQTGLVNPRYYFWVTGKENTSGKKKNNSAAIIRNIIENPELQGVAYAGLLRSDAITLFNVNNYLSGDNIILQIDYANIANENTIHSEYELVQENRGESLIPEKIVTKMIDSLAGIDRIGNVVPDPRLGEVDRIGISFKPRQNMFRDRTRALKSMVEYVNSVFKQYPVTRQFNIAGFFKQDPIPASVNYNLSVPIVDELDYINTDDLSVGYRVLVENDSSNDGLWTIWRFNGNNFELSRIQSYKTDLYWEYQDWYAEDYDPSTKITYTVNTDKDLAALSVSVDDIIKVLFDYTGNFMIYRVTDDLSLETVAIGNGTIRLSDSLYALAFNGMGFDSANYDMVRYDKTPGIEIRNIIETVKDNIFINEFQLEFNRMFFTVINYLLTEQKHVDWVFKTSFISVVHRLRKLDQYPSFVRDNQDYYIDYINEVKPYRTQIREYLLNYQGIDSYNSDVSDFDIPAYYDSELDQYRSPSGELSKDTEILNLEKYQNWKSNHTYVIDQIIIENPGKDYAITPVITIEGGGGSGAEAIAITDFNEITSVVITNPGSGYTSTPTVTVNGIGLGGKVYPVLRGVYSRNEEQNPQGYNLVRSFNPTIKFDRTAYTSSIPAWESNTVIYADRVSYENQVYRPKENNVFHVAIELSAIESFNVTLIDTYAIEGIVVDEDVPVYINNQYIDYEDDLYEIIPGSNSLRFLDVNPGDEIKVLLNSGEEEETFETFRIVTVSDFVVNKPLLPNTKVYLGDRLQVLDENYTIDEANNEINFIVDPETYILPLGYSVKVLVDPTLGVVIAPEDVPGAVEDDGEWILTTDYGQLSLSNIDDISEEQRVRGSGINTFNNEVHVLEINDNLIKFASQQRMRLVNGVWINDPLPPVAVTGNAVIEILTFITGIETTPIFDYRLFDLVPGDQSGNALDRVTSYYKPVEGGSGANPSQAIKGITYPGVKVQGLPFDESEDLASTSDLVDTHISSRYLDSSLGTRPEDITVDGGAYIDKFSSHAPEELIPGIMFDNLNFQIFTKPFEPWTSTFAGDGGIRDFNLGRKTDYFSLIVLLDGQPQIANEDFYLINNGNTIRFEITPADGKSIVVKGFIGTGNVYGHRYLHDIKETRKYYRISQAHTTTLRQPLGISATEILISDASVLPIPGLREPSRVIINGEIISYLEIDLANNKLKRLRRGVDGTGSPLSHPVGTRVVDISDNQLLPGNADGADWMNSTQEFGFREVGDFDYYNYDADKDGILPDADPAYDPEDPDYEGYGVITGVKGAIFDALDTIGGGTTPTEQARFLAKSASFNP